MTGFFICCGLIFLGACIENGLKALACAIASIPNEPIRAAASIGEKT